MKLRNNSKYNLRHDQYFLPIGNINEIPENIAKIWLSINGVEKYSDPAEAEKKEEKLKSEIEKLKQENKKLKDTKTKSTKKTQKTQKGSK